MTEAATTAAQAIPAQWPYALASLLLAAGMWLLLPRGERSGYRLGGGLAAVGIALLFMLVHFGLAFLRDGAERMVFDTQLPALGSWSADIVFLVLAAVTVGSALGAVSCRSPVYCAIWFAMTLLGTAGIFLYQGAQFLGVATIVVYAGAILVTFLFVLMLAQPEGHAFYDRVSWEGPLSACSGAVMVGLLTMTLAVALRAPVAAEGQSAERFWLDSTLSADRSVAEGQSAAEQSGGVLNSEHVATLGGELFSTHLIAVELAGTLLMVALVGAIAIVAHSHGSSRAAHETLQVVTHG
jgi:NADH-quinone oxidoreductase subunit J